MDRAMSRGQTYQGYANYQTWNICLWINNDAGLLEHWQERARANPEDLADELQEWAEQNRPEVTGFYSDLLNHGLGMVYWQDVAENLLTE